jgi:hypothetical protein
MKLPTKTEAKEVFTRSTGTDRPLQFYGGRVNIEIHGSENPYGRYCL